ncbi:glycoside hydrolase family 25 protein [Flavobacterium sp. NST-5]|uniref:Glycoside hydrolase family 25 protein n=1 Tax=Flavobacterium ichthyis TaxID=2698827 RepID=A0ABW9Z8B2_9FLAO|nr:glycoside hydrolase family 25 protein [Flavobacterium ichthyis]NBL64859.1 glycoside hydrolase family 25 protein [Flavobacterium ichthyis]
MKKASSKAKAKSRKVVKRPWLSGLRLKVLLWILAVAIMGGLGYHYRVALAYYFSFKTDKKLSPKEKKLAEARIKDVLEGHEGKIFGFDVSEYQGMIDWEKARNIQQKYPLEFVFVRATAGKNRVDAKFLRNWKSAKKHNLVRGAYHYYRPNENSLEQAKNFIKTVKLIKGDLPPVLDIEQLPKNQSIDSLKVGLQRWLDKVEAHYKVKPIIYSGESYYRDFLEEEFSEYYFWIANYNYFVEEIKDDWLFWQFSEQATIPGIKGLVDVNVYNGTKKQLLYYAVD